MRLTKPYFFGMITLVTKFNFVALSFAKNGLCAEVRSSLYWARSFRKDSP